MEGAVPVASPAHCLVGLKLRLSMVQAESCAAILRDEPQAETFAHAIESSSVRRLSAPNFIEAAVIIDASRDPIASRWFDDLIKEAQIIIELVTEEQARIARGAYRDFGRGSGHPAKLNFGDCFAYALAKFTAEPLLFKGDDFARTDIKRGGRQD
jgi:ribonuclease VapC